jgi:hypothetical protein
MYDITGSVLGILYNNTPYYFMRNLQGDVIGGTGGTFVAPYYTDPMSLSLPYHQLPNMCDPTMYIVNQQITVISGQAAPWFGQYGGGTQYILPQTIQELINSGILSGF